MIVIVQHKIKLGRMISGTMACETWRGSLWSERISESRRPRFEPDIDNAPQEIF